VILVTTYASDGLILQNLTVLNENEADLNGSWVEGHWDSREHHISGGEALLRPTISMPAAHVLAVDEDWEVPDVPAGATVFVDGAEVGTVDEGGLTLNFGFPGLYVVRISPPFPVREAHCEVTVT
jgi:hypothetical protein